MDHPADKFACYMRDATGLDYAEQRYFSSVSARFLSTDPYPGSASLQNPKSWNRYGYSSGDPVNSSDPSGLADCGTEGGGLCLIDDGAGSTGGTCILDGLPTDCSMVNGMLAGGMAMTPGEYQALLYSQFDQASLSEARQRARDAQLGVVASALNALGPNPSYKQVVDAMINAFGLPTDAISMNWTGKGYELYDNGTGALTTLQAALEGSAAFASGGLGILHWDQTGTFSADFRSMTNDGAPYSLQVTIGPKGGWLDIDGHNPYQSVGEFWNHSIFEVFGKRDRPFVNPPAQASDPSAYNTATRSELAASAPQCSRGGSTCSP